MSEETKEFEAWREWAELSSKIEFHARDQYAMSNPNSTKQQRDEYAKQVSESDEDCQRLYDAWQQILTTKTK